MTMLTCGRVVPLGVADSVVGTFMFIATLNLAVVSEITGDAQPLEGIFGFVIQCSARTFRHLGAVEFDQDFVDVGGGRGHGIGDVGVAQRAVALAVFRQIKRDDRNVFALGVGPDVGLGPMQD